MKNRSSLFLLAFLLFIPTFASAQLSLTTSGSTVTIDFDNTLAGVNNGAFAGTGFQPTPSAGQLNSNAWAMTGLSDGSLAFGGTQNSGDFARGNTTVAVTTGGIYSHDTLSQRRLMIQPAGGDWAPGTLTLRIQNNTGSPLRQIDIAYDLWVRNDQNRANSFNFSFSTDDATYTPVPSMDYTSPATAVSGAVFQLVGTSPSRRLRIAGLDIPNGGYFYARWSGADVSGTGSRDEFALDNIAVTGFTSNLIAAGAYRNLLIVGDPSGDRPSLAGDITPDSLAILPTGALDGLNNQILGTGSMTIRGRFVTQRQDGLSGTANAAFPSASFTLDSLSTIRYERASGTQSVTARTDYGNLEVAGGSSKSFTTGAILIRGTLTLVASTLDVGNNSLTFRSGNAPIARNGVTETGTLSFGTGASLNFGDVTSQFGAAFTIPDNCFTTIPFIQSLSINRNNAITLGNQNIFSNTLTLTSGIFIVSGGGSTASGAIIVSTDSPTAITGGSATSHVRGTLRRRLQSSVSVDGFSYFFPIADASGTYRPAKLVNVRTDSGLCTMQITASATGASTFDATLLSVRAPHWLIEENDLPSDFTSATLELTGTSLINGENLIGATGDAPSDTVSGTYSSIGGTVSGSTITSNPQALTLKPTSRARYVAIGAFTAEPTTQASGISFSSVTASSFTINWTSGNGANRLVVMRQGAPVSFTPVDGANYSGINSVFSLASNQDTDNNRIVFAGTGSSVNVTGLSGNTTYHVAIYEFNGTLTNNAANFLTTSPPTASQTTVPNQPTVNVNTLTFSNFQTNQLTLSWNVPTGDVGANRVVVVRAGSAPVAPSDFKGYTANSVFGSGDTTGAGTGFVVYNGNSPNTVTVTGLSPETQYFFGIFEYNGSGSTANYNPSGANANRWTLKNEPTPGVSTLVISSITKTSMKLDWSGTSHDSVIIFRRPVSNATFEPADGRAYNVGELDPTGWRVVAKLVGTTTTLTVTGLSSGTTHYFRVYAFNQNVGSAQTANYRTASGVAENNASTLSGTTYQWNNASGGAWTTGSNWTPSGPPSDGDKALFNNDAAFTVSSVPTTSIGAIEVAGNTSVTFTAGAAQTVSLTGFGSGSGNALNVGADSLIIGGTNAITLSIQSGNTGRVSGAIRVGFNGSRITSSDSAGIVVESGGIVIASGAAGGLFGTSGTASSVVFDNGATYIHNSSGGNPFQTSGGIARFLSNSNYIQQTTGGFSANGRTFGNLEFSNTGTLNATGATLMTIAGSLTKNNTGTVGLNLTGGVNIGGNLSANAGTLTFSPASASTVTFNGSSLQQITAGAGTLTFGANANLALNNPSGLQLGRPITLQANLALTNGILDANAHALTLSTTATVSGGNDNSYVIGTIAREFNDTLKSRLYPFGSFGRYRPISIRGNTSSGTATMSGRLFDIDANTRGSIADPPNRVSTVRHYGFQVTGASINIDQVPVLRANVDDGVGSFLSNTSLRIATARNGTGWTLRNLSSPPNTTALPLDLSSETGLAFTAFVAPDSALFALGSSSNTDNPLPVELLFYAGESTSEGAVLKWATASEIDNLGFTILKDGEVIASFANEPSLRGRGTTTEETRYRFVDSKVKVGEVHQYALRQTDLNGTVHELGTLTLVITTAVAPREYSLSQNYPNPFNPTTVIAYSLKEAGEVKLELFDVLGRKVGTLVNARQDAGTYQVSVAASRYGLASGLYFYRLQSGGFVATKKMLLVK